MYQILVTTYSFQQGHINTIVLSFDNYSSAISAYDAIKAIENMPRYTQIATKLF